MSKNDDDEFNDVVKGLPSEDTAQKSSIKFILIFLIGGIVITIAIFQLGNWFRYAVDENNYIIPQMLMNGSISLLIGSLQAWIFKSKIKSRIANFIAFSILGGVVGGFVGGLLLNNYVTNSFLIGFVNGVIAGGISSLAQNRLMGNKKYGARWFFYNASSWAVIFSIAWTIGWNPDSLPLTALAGGFLMIASGISLVIFLRKTPQIEFS